MINYKKYKRTLNQIKRTLNQIKRTLNQIKVFDIFDCDVILEVVYIRLI